MQVDYITAIKIVCPQQLISHQLFKLKQVPFVFRSLYERCMPVNFLTDEQNQTYACYPDNLSQEQLDKYFYLDDKDRELINACRRDYNKLGYALQLTTVRFLGTFLSDPLEVPSDAINYITKQLGINRPTDINHYMARKATRSVHCN